MEKELTIKQKKEFINNQLNSSLKILYRLEFNERTQQFHLDNGTHKEYTHGWHTIFKFISDLDHEFFMAYLDYENSKNLTLEQVLQAKSKSSQFLKNLKKYNLQIKKSK